MNCPKPQPMINKNNEEKNQKENLTALDLLYLHLLSCSISELKVNLLKKYF